MTAADSLLSGDNASSELAWASNVALRRIGITCRTAADGRRAVRALSQWAERFELSEPEFQVLWCLRWACGDGFDQTTLAKHLSYSPAQVSGTVERMRLRGWITQHQPAGDRRRHLWKLSSDGQALLEEMLNVASHLRYPATDAGNVTAHDCPGREAA